MIRNMKKEVLPATLRPVYLFLATIPLMLMITVFAAYLMAETILVLADKFTPSIVSEITPDVNDAGISTPPGAGSYAPRLLDVHTVDMVEPPLLNYPDDINRYPLGYSNTCAYDVFQSRSFIRYRGRKIYPRYY